MEIKDWLGIIVVPVGLALLGFVWPWTQDGLRRRGFRRLILRELEEVSPYPKTASKDGWWDHCQKRFIHREILQKPTENRDFILSLEPDLVYLVTQLWDSLDKHNWEQWDYMFKELETDHCTSHEFKQHHNEWIELHREYVQLGDRPGQ